MTGVKIDSEFLGALSRGYAARILLLEESIYREAGERFNLGSTQKLREVLFDRLKLQPSRRTKTGFSTDADVLEGLSGQHPAVSLMLEWRQLMKLKTTYVDALPRLVNPETGRVHTSYNQAVATTGRLSSSEPNLQNIPIRTTEGREIRRAFVARDPDWVLLDADYSQIELRILAHLSGDEGLVRAFPDRIAVNTPVQGTAADIMKLAMVAADREISRRGLAMRMILTVHDELLFDVPRAELDEATALVKASMEGAMSLCVPLKVET